MKYIYVFGAVISGVGKGTFACNLAALLRSSGFTVTMAKIDPYFNVDAGTLGPTEHGETFVLSDGGETDLDLGNYERAIPVTLTKLHNLTSGKLYQSILFKERQGNYYEGKTVQMIPDAMTEILDWFKYVGKVKVDKENKDAENDICIIEIGGTAGDYESNIFYEALRVHNLEDKENIANILITWIPEVGRDAEHKTKPTQHGIKDLKMMGCFIDFMVSRSVTPLSKKNQAKIAYYANIPEKHSYNLPNSNPYSVATKIFEIGLLEEVLIKLNLPYKGCKVDKYYKLRELHLQLETNHENIKKVNIVLLGKYCNHTESYHSVEIALRHASLNANAKLNLTFLDAPDYDTILAEVKNANKAKKTYEEKMEEAREKIAKADGVIVPGGFGSRGVESMISLITLIRTKKIPFLGICLGMQMAVIEFAREVIGWKDANSLEFCNPDKDKIMHDVITLMEDTSYSQLGGTMRRGQIRCYFENKDSLGYMIYKKDSVMERHRHRYEVNNKSKAYFSEKGMYFAGVNNEGTRFETVELDRSIHPFFFGSQYHPEYNSRMFEVSKPFYAFILASLGEYKQIATYPKDFCLENKFDEYLKVNSDILGVKPDIPTEIPEKSVHRSFDSIIDAVSKILTSANLKSAIEELKQASKEKGKSPAKRIDTQANKQLVKNSEKKEEIMEEKVASHEDKNKVENLADKTVLLQDLISGIEKVIELDKKIKSGNTNPVVTDSKGLFAATKCEAIEEKNEKKETEIQGTSPEDIQKYYSVVKDINNNLSGIHQKMNLLLQLNPVINSIQLSLAENSKFFDNSSRENLPFIQNKCSITEESIERIRDFQNKYELFIQAYANESFINAQNTFKAAENFLCEAVNVNKLNSILETLSDIKNLKSVEIEKQVENAKKYSITNENFFGFYPKK